MKQIKVLGSGCRNCEITANVIAQEAKDAGVEVKLKRSQTSQRSWLTGSCPRRVWSWMEKLCTLADCLALIRRGYGYGIKQIYWRRLPVNLRASRTASVSPSIARITRPDTLAGFGLPHQYNVHRSEEPPYKKSSRLRAISSYLVDFCGDRKDKTARPTRGCGSAQTERLCSYCVLDVPDSVPCGMLSSRVLPSMNGLDRDSFLTHRCHTQGVQTSPPPGRSRRLT